MLFTVLFSPVSEYATVLSSTRGYFFFRVGASLDYAVTVCLRTVWL